MLKDKWLFIAILILAVSILVSGFWIKKALFELAVCSPHTTQDSMQKLSSQLQELNLTLRKLSSISINEPQKNQLISLLPNPNSLYLEQASDYLGISKENLVKIINDSNSGIPYLKTNSKTYIFNKKSLDKWLETSYVIP